MSADLIARLTLTVAVLERAEREGPGHFSRGECSALLLDVREAIAALRAERGAEGWEPIESAPEGVIILWCSMRTGDVSKWCFVDWCAGGRFMLHPKWEATHWRPLPPPPAGSSGESEGR